VRVCTQPQQGKATALNMGIAWTRYDIIVTVDADTILRPGAIAALVRHFADPRTGAVSGNVRVANRHTWLTRFQSIEYTCVLNLERRAMDVLNAITVVPGAVGAWRRALIQQGAGFANDTLAEDTDLTLAIRKLGYRVRYEEHAVGYTEVPEDARSLVKQRLRWQFGTLQAAWKHGRAFGRPHYGSLGMVTLPSIWLFQMVAPLLSPLAETMMLIGLSTGNGPMVFRYYGGLLLVEGLAALLAYALEGAEPGELIFLVIQRVYYRQLLLYVTGKSLVSALKGKRLKWSKVDRRPWTPSPKWSTNRN